MKYACMYIDVEGRTITKTVKNEFYIEAEHVRYVFDYYCTEKQEDESMPEIDKHYMNDQYIGWINISSILKYFSNGINKYSIQIYAYNEEAGIRLAFETESECDKIFSDLIKWKYETKHYYSLS